MKQSLSYHQESKSLMPLGGQHGPGVAVHDIVIAGASASIGGFSGSCGVCGVEDRSKLHKAGGSQKVSMTSMHEEELYCNCIN